MPRRTAVDALETMHRTSALAAEAVGALLRQRKMSPEDQGLLWEIVHGVTRHRTTIDRILEAFSRLKLDRVQPRVLQALRVAVYQMVWLDRIPAPSAVYESVEIVKRGFPVWVTKFVNGCLRSVVRAIDLKVGGRLPPEDRARAVPVRGLRYCLFTEPFLPDPAVDLPGMLALQFGHPPWLVARWLREYGEAETEELLWAGNEPPSTWLRPAPGRMADLTRALAKRGISHEVVEEPCPALRLPLPPGPVTDLPGYARGWFVVQDRTAMAAAVLLAPRPGERVLDLCAAPGGKTTHLAELGGPEAIVVAVDRDSGRLQRVAETRDRLGLTNIATVVADGLDTSVDLGGPFDAVLVDAPCSNTGVLAKRVEVRHKVEPEAVAGLAEVQRGLLLAAADRLRPGGRIVYSTCSILSEENREVVAALLAARPGFALLGEYECRPRIGYSDGGYAALLRKADEPSAAEIGAEPPPPGVESCD